ncbi:nucleoside hydrolase [Thermonema rossianum]|uniref:nucleoside hydrolase n=1 Tax=Thermonema rossianum TaxID=55505 RepID=UPI0009FE87AE|nr:nucleoside hydrolase [Thermonema rossianum]
MTMLPMRLYLSKCLLFLFCCLWGGHMHLAGQPSAIIIDADTGNSIDDLYAIAYLLQQAGSRVVALTAAHFNNPDLLSYRHWNGYSTKGIRTMKISYRLNKKLLRAAGCRHYVRCVPGASSMVGRAWGGSTPRPSAASRLIIEEAIKLNDDEKLHVIVTGPVTNVVSAIIEQPQIAHRLVVYAMGGDYDPKKGVWNKAEFNVRNDLNAFDYLLNSEVELHIMPESVARQLVFPKEETQQKLARVGGKLSSCLSKRWQRLGEVEAWSMWDLALAIAYMQPLLAREEEVFTPPENRQRKVWVYTAIDAPAMKAAFWNSYLSPDN